VRLTLRTMLAYMDDILEPEDAADIGKKLEESDLAKGIMHRLRDSIRRLRLGAPAPLGHGMALDPNSVAEYLDNTLPAEQVGEFEKICLESDVHLAEVGACHQILTLVLGEPAEVDAAARERMYHLAARSAAPQAAAPQAAAPQPVAPAPTPAAAPVQPVRRAKPEVPDYLREPRSRNWGVLAAIVMLAGIVCGGIATAVFLPEMRRIIAGWRGEQLADNAPPEGQEVADARPTPPPTEETLPPDEPQAADAAPNASATEQSAVETPAPETTADAGNETQTAEESGEAMPEQPTEPEPAAAIPTPGDEMPKPAVAAGAAAPVEETPTGEVLGRYLYKQDVLLRMDRGTRLWRRLPATPSLAAGDRLMSLASFRPTITLIAGVTIQPVDASVFDLLGADDAGVPAINIEYGRLILFTAGKPHNSIRLRIGDHQALLTFLDGESTVAIDVRRLWIAGRDPAAAAGRLAVDLFVTSGAVTWEEGPARLEWKAPSHAILESQGAQVLDNEIAKWTRGESPKGIELGAAEAIEHELTGDQPISLSIKELLSSRKVEVRGLAVRAAANVGEFEQLVKMLNDPDQKLIWHIEIEALRTAMARDPETAEQIQAAFKTRRGDVDGSELYRMLWGYSAEDVADGVMNKLVEYLNNDDWLDIRVLAFQNLREITGKPLSYKPEASSAVRRPAYLNWKARIKELKPAPGTNR